LSRAPAGLAAAIALLLAQAVSAQPGELVDRTLAIVGTQVITLGDVRAALVLGLVEGGPSAGAAAAATERLIERELILREVQRYAPPPPEASAVEARLAELRRRFPEPEFTRVLAEGGFTEARLRAWIADDLRTQAYLAQRFASASTPTDADIAAAFTVERPEFERAGVTFEQATPILRERLTAARRRELITDWISDLRRRTDVTVLPQ
jgi:hypothetical protein